MQTNTDGRPARHSAWFLRYPLLLIPILVSLDGCVSHEALDLRSGQVGFASVLRADLGPTMGMSPPRFFGDHRVNTDGRVSILHFSNVAPEQLNQLRLSRTFWIEREGFSRISYEVVLRKVEFVFQEAVSTARSVGACTAVLDGAKTDLSDADTRGDLVITPPLPIGILRPTSFEENFGGFTVVSTACTSGAASTDPYNPPTPLTGVCASRDLRTLVAVERAQPFPFCIIGGQFENLTNDVSYGLQVRNADSSALDPKFTAPVTAVLPHVKTVGESRRLARRMSYAGLEAGPDGTMRHRWRWQVEIEDGLWKENFSPHLMVARAWVFYEGETDPNTNRPRRIYLTPAPLIVGTVRNDGTLNRIGDCDNTQTDTDDRMFVNVPDCLGRVTPTYANSLLASGARLDDAERLAWDYVFPFDAPSDLPFNPAITPVYIEYDVAYDAFGTSGSSLLAEPAGKDLGGVRVGTPSSFPTAFRVFNNGAASARITALSFEGPHAADFSARLDGGGLPAWIVGGSSIGITVDVNASAQSERRATLVISGGTNQTLRVGVEAHGRSPSLDVLPTQLRFTRAPDRPDPQPNALPGFLVINNGGLPFVRTGFLLRGANRAAFTLVRSEYGNSPSQSPPPARRTIEPGNSEAIRILYHPPTVGDHTAEIVVSTDAGSAAIALTGSCTGPCNYEPPFAFGDVTNVRVALDQSARLARDVTVVSILKELTPSAAVVLLNLGRSDPKTGASADEAKRRRGATEQLLTPDHVRTLLAAGLIETDKKPAKGPRKHYRLTLKGARVYRALAAAPVLAGRPQTSPR